MNETRQRLFDVMRKTQQAERLLKESYDAYKDGLHISLYKALKRLDQKPLAEDSQEALDRIRAALNNAGNAAQSLEQICEALNIRE